MAAAPLKAADANVNRNNVFRVDDALSVLRSTLLYGANAGGKSNLLGALGFMCGLVVNSARGQVGDPIKTEPFALHPDLPEETSTFEAVFRVDGIQYRYGFEVTRERVVNEWMYYVKKRENLLFLRNGDTLKIMDAFQAARPVKPLTRPNALFLSVAAQFNVEQAKGIVTWFRSIGVIWSFEHVHNYTARRVEEEPQFRKKIGDLMGRLDTDIQAVSSSRRALDRAGLPAELPAALVDLILREGESFDVQTRHAIRDDEGLVLGATDFGLEQQESGGTQKAFALLGPILDSLENGTVLVIDEFDARLHSTLAKALWQLFHDDATNPKGAQLIASTHDTSLLDKKLLRRDQVWFVEKDKRAQSQLYSLAEMRVRNDASYEQDYLHGRYGGVPFPRGLKAALLERDG